jgi:hypothetical protein
MRLKALLLCALFGVACSSTEPGSDTTDGGATPTDGGQTVADGGPGDAGQVDTNVVVEESFESPEVAAGGFSTTLPKSFAFVADGLDFVKIARPTTDFLEAAAPLAAPADGSQALMIQASTEVNVQLPTLATVRSGEKWTLEFALAAPKTATAAPRFDPYFLADLSYYDGETVEISTVKLDDVKGQFATVTATWTVPAEADGMSLSVGAYFSSAAGGLPSQYLLDHVRVRRTYSPDNTPIKPYEMHVWNHSFEFARPDPGGVWEPEWTTSQWGWNVEKTSEAGAFMWRPTTLQVNQAEPLASPADQYTVVDLGLKSQGVLETQSVRLSSTEFAIAQEGKAYQAQVAVGLRKGIPLCTVNKVSIEQDGVALATTTVTNGEVPEGGFLNVSVQTPAISAANTGKALRAVISAEQPGGNSVVLCRTMFDNVRAGVVNKVE